MVVKHRKKSVRYRGQTKHGYGRKSKHRGAGNRGGKGHASWGKRGHARKPSHRIEKSGPRRIGFNYHGTNLQHVPVTLDSLQQNMEKYLAAGTAKKEGDSYVLNLEQLGYTKVLGTGRVTKKLKLTALAFSAGAKEKIESAGGVANVAGGDAQEEKPKATPAKEQKATKAPAPKKA